MENLSLCLINEALRQEDLWEVVVEIHCFLEFGTSCTLVVSLELQPH
jgi:hypothetical protein